MTPLKLTDSHTLPQSKFVSLQSPPLSQFGPQSELSKVPTTSLAEHKNQMGFVTSALPSNMMLKANAKLPRFCPFQNQTGRTSGSLYKICKL